MFMDEARFGRVSNPRRCWAPHGIRPVVATQVIREYLYVYASVCPFDGEMEALIASEVNAKVMSIYLDQVSKQFSQEHVVLIMDQAGWHKAKRVKIPENISVYWLPPYSPELNPVEHLWDEIREKWFNNRIFLSMEQISDKLTEVLRYLINSPKYIQSLTLFSWMST